MGTDYHYLYIGTYTSIEAPGCRREDACGRGIYLFERQEDGGFDKYQNRTEEEMDQDIYPAYNPSYLEMDRQHKYLYAVEETEYHGTILCYAVKEKGRLEFQERYFFRGGGSCHIMITRDNRYLIVSDYQGGCITIFERQEDGGLKYVMQHQHEGKGVRTDRQEGPHAHSTLELADGSIVTADLGTDELICLKRMDLDMDEDEDKLTLWQEHESWKLPEGCGPRHMALSLNGRYLYVLTELSCELMILDLKRKKQIVGCYSVRYRPGRSENFGEGVRDEHTENLSADLHISEDRKHLYVSNRGLDSIVIFQVRARGGVLELQGVYSCGGRGPRSFALSKEHLIVANQGTANVIIFKLAQNGGIKQQEGELKVPRASKVLLLQDSASRFE